MSGDYNSYVLGATQSVEFTDTAAASTALTAEDTLSQTTVLVRIAPTVDCFYAVGEAPVAAATGIPLGAFSYEYIEVPVGHKISAVRAGTTSGSLSVVKCKRL